MADSAAPATEAEQRAHQKRPKEDNESAKAEEPAGKKVNEAGGIGQKREAEVAALGGEAEEPQATRRKEGDPTDTEVIRALMEAARACAMARVEGKKDVWRKGEAVAGEVRRVQAEAEKFGLGPGEVMDLTVGWDFTKAEERARGREYFNRCMPKVIIGSPMCAIASPLQRMTPWNSEKQHRWRERRGHIKFISELYREQLRGGRYFLHEHPSPHASVGDGRHTGRSG